MPRAKAIILLSGGLDSTTTLYYARSKGFRCFALIFDYGQRHRREIRSAVAVAKRARVPYQLLKIRFPWKGSALLDRRIKLPRNRKMRGIPATYVPARNLVFLSLALSYAEAIGAGTVMIGANAVDFSGYPDCRPAFYREFRRAARQGVKAKGIKIVTPLLRLTKERIVRLGRRLGAPLELTWSCYRGGRRPCGVCDACRLRAKGFLLYNKRS
jgi:7-cyano-7-deazaguanine synthase